MLDGQISRRCWLAAAAKTLIPKSSSLLALHVSTLLGFAPTHNQCPKTKQINAPTRRRCRYDDLTFRSSIWICKTGYYLVDPQLPGFDRLCAESACTSARTLARLFRLFSSPRGGERTRRPRCRGSSSPDERAGWVLFGVPDQTAVLRSSTRCATTTSSVRTRGSPLG